MQHYKNRIEKLEENTCGKGRNELCSDVLPLMWRRVFITLHRRLRNEFPK